MLVEHALQGDEYDWRQRQINNCAPGKTQLNLITGKLGNLNRSNQHSKNWQTELGEVRKLREKMICASGMSNQVTLYLNKRNANSTDELINVRKWVSKRQDKSTRKKNNRRHRQECTHVCTKIQDNYTTLNIPLGPCFVPSLCFTYRCSCSWLQLVWSTTQQTNAKNAAGLQGKIFYPEANNSSQGTPCINNGDWSTKGSGSEGVFRTRAGTWDKILGFKQSKILGETSDIE